MWKWGMDVGHLKVGDRVALELGKTCGHCEFCKTRNSHVVFFAIPSVDRVFQEYATHEANLCFKLPDNVSTMEGTLIEPLAVGFHAPVLCKKIYTIKSGFSICPQYRTGACSLAHSGQAVFLH